MKNQPRPKRLVEAENEKEQIAIIREMLLSGKTLSDPRLWVAGVRDPAAAIKKLRKSGLKIQTVYVKTVDAAGEVHPRTPAWRLAEEERQDHAPQSP